MSERRSGERLLLAPPGLGTLRVRQDVEVKYLDAGIGVVITQNTIPLGERLLLEVPDERLSRAHAWLAHAVSSRVVAGEGTLRRETHLWIARRTEDVAPPPEAVASSVDRTVMGSLLRRVPVRLVQASRSGCLGESPVPVEEGTVGFIEVRASHQSHTETVRIVRTWRSVGQIWPHRVAVEFMTLTPPTPDSLRGVAALMAVGTPTRRIP
jgi:hypothetical protein